MTEKRTRTPKTPGPLAAATAEVVIEMLKSRGIAVSALDGILGAHAYVQDRLGGSRKLALDLNDLQRVAEVLAVSPVTILRDARSRAGAVPLAPASETTEQRRASLTAEVVALDSRRIPDRKATARAARRGDKDD